MEVHKVIVNQPKPEDENHHQCVNYVSEFLSDVRNAMLYINRWLNNLGTQLNWP